MKITLLALNLFSICYISVSQEWLKPPPDTTISIFTIIENAPEFPGGEVGMQTYIRQNVKYPFKAYQLDITGTVVVQFIIDSTGKVLNPEIKKSVHSILDKEALKVVSKMPRWTPAYNKGVPLNVRMMLPITF